MGDVDLSKGREKQKYIISAISRSVIISKKVKKIFFREKNVDCNTTAIKFNICSQFT